MKPAREPASSHPKPCASLKKPHESCPFAAPCGPRRKKKKRVQTSAFPSETSRFAPLILAHRGSALPWLVDDRAALRLLRICRPVSTDRLNRESSQLAASLEGEPYTRRKDPPTLIPRNQVSGGEGTMCYAIEPYNNRDLGPQKNVGEKPTDILCNCINRHAGTPIKTQTKATISLDYTSTCYIGSRIGWVSTKEI